MPEPTDFRRRQRGSTLSRWELGDLLGIHPHQLPDSSIHDPNLAYLPVSVLIDLAQRLDMHPGDLAPGLNTVLTNHRVRLPEPPVEASVTSDALTVLTALATALTALTTDQLATALQWTPDRTRAALEYAAAHPHLAGPIALRRCAPHTYTVSARLDLLTHEQRTNVLDTVRHSAALTVEQANVILAAILLRNEHQYARLPTFMDHNPVPYYADWRDDHLDTEQQLRAAGILHADYKPDNMQVNPEVLYSLRYRDSPTEF